MVVYPSFPLSRVCQKADFEVRTAKTVIPAPSVIPAKAGIQEWWRGATAAFPRSAPPGFPLSRGMTISGVCASLGWRFDTACFAGMTDSRRRCLVRTTDSYH